MVTAIVVVVILLVMLRVMSSRRMRQRHEKYNIPNEAYVLRYVSGLSGFQSNKLAYVWREADQLNIVSFAGARKEIQLSQIAHLQFNEDIRLVTKGGGASLTGAIVGDMVAGPVGAIIGSRKRTKTQKVDESTLSIVTHSSSGIEVEVKFKAKQGVYNKVADMLGATI